MSKKPTETGSILKRHKTIYEWALAYVCEFPGTDSDELRGLIYKAFGKEYVNKSYEMMIVSLCAVEKAKATARETILNDLPLFSGEV